MKLFIIKLIRFSIILFLPFSLLLAGYLYFDPFKVLYKYSDYSNSSVIPNRDYVSTEMFLKNSNSYDSFLFGSSRTLAFKTNSWQQYLPSGSKPFIFDASAESIYGIFTKIKYLDSTGQKINNTIILLCRDVSFAYSKNHKGHLFIKHPVTSGYSKLDFQKVFLDAYLNPKFILSFYTYTITKKYKSWMKGYIEDRKIVFDTLTNEMTILDQEKELNENQEKYYLKRKDIFYERKNESIDSVRRIKPDHEKMLREIKKILTNQKSSYKIVLSPLYDQVKFNENDMTLLKEIFQDKLHDFTGKNNLTEPISNYYEANHYRPMVGDSIFKIIYNHNEFKH